MERVKQFPELLRQASKRKVVVKSIQTLESIHNELALSIKYLKRCFIKRGLMMSTMNYIDVLLEQDPVNVKGIKQLLESLYREHAVMRRWNSNIRYDKYEELIEYCEFLLLSIDRPNEIDTYLAGKKLIHRLNIGHELGHTIHKRVLQILL